MRRSARMLTAALTAVIALVSQVALAQTTPDDPFIVPDILTANVAFWKKIYTEVSLTEGLFHDRDYPMIIYEKVSIGQMGDRAYHALLKSHELQIRAALTAIAAKSPDDLRPEEKQIKDLFDSYAPPEALAGAPERIRFQQGQKERFVEGLDRAGMYIDTMRAILASHGVPVRLAYLPHVESSFDVNAYSKCGAAGLWQFMSSSGRIYGLHSDYVADQRRDPVLATEAAARMLADNYTQLQAWPLAITAYNYGLSGMMRAVETTGSRDLGVIIEKHASPTFKFASKNFYGCFIAASEIADSPDVYLGAVSMHERLTWTDLTLTHHVRPEVLCSYLGVQEQILRKLNPALRPVVFQQQKQIPQGFVLHLPSTMAPETALAALGRIPDSLRSDKPDRPNYYRVRRGDNLYTIASRLGVSPRDIALENNITRASRIYAGQVLQIPGAGKIAVDTQSAASLAMAEPEGGTASESAAIARVIPPSETAVAAAPSSAQAPRPKAALAKPVRAQLAATGPSPAPPPGDSLASVIMATADTVTTASPRSRPSTMSRFDVEVYNLETVLVTPGMAEIHVTVDETVGHYADWLGVSIARIRQVNRIRGGSSIRIDQSLMIPIDHEGALEQFAKARLEYHMMLEEDFYARYKVVDVKPKIVVRGENLWDICNADDQTPLWLFRKHNRYLDLARLMPGTTVWMPLVREKTEEDIALEQLDDGGVYPAYRVALRAQAGPITLVP